MRVGDAERDAAAADLGEHYTAGRLTIDELHERLESVFAAKTFGQLARIMSDLPGSARLAALSSPFGPVAMPGAPGLPWMPATRPRYHWGGYWNTSTRHGAAMGPTAGFPPGARFGPGGRFQARDGQRESPPVDRVAKFAALSLLILAMLIWLFTALLFARHGGLSTPLGTGGGSFPGH
jgi:hypothetical protein